MTTTEDLLLQHTDGTPCAGARCAFITTGGHAVGRGGVLITVEKYTTTQPCDYSERDIEGALLQCAERPAYRKVVTDARRDTTTYTHWCGLHIARQAIGVGYRTRP